MPRKCCADCPCQTNCHWQPRSTRLPWLFRFDEDTGIATAQLKFVIWMVLLMLIPIVVASAFDGLSFLFRAACAAR